jgi:spore coat polysaccharide biosynthesis protein SpsF
MRPRTVAIVQARMGSTRLPGKVMMTIAEQTILTYLVRRIMRARTLDEVVVATTTDARDDVIVEECARNQVPSFRGSELDVLARYAAAAAAFDAGIIVRVTADNPFTDPDSIDRVVESVAAGADYAVETNLPVGTTAEALSRQALTLIDSVAHTDQWREHVTLYAKDNPHALKCAFLQPRPDCNRPDLSFTVDTYPEFLYSKGLAAQLPDKSFALKTLIAFADETLDGDKGVE